MSIAIASPSHFSLRRFVRLVIHEAAHLRGIVHGRMCQNGKPACNLLYSTGPLPEWAKGVRIRYHGRAPDQLATLARDGLTRR
jgi:hypothetical protein